MVYLVTWLIGSILGTISLKIVSWFGNSSASLAKIAISAGAVEMIALVEKLMWPMPLISSFVLLMIMLTICDIKGLHAFFGLILYSIVKFTLGFFIITALFS